jgi:chromosome segregation ATPase
LQGRRLNVKQLEEELMDVVRTLQERLEKANRSSGDCDTKVEELETKFGEKEKELSQVVAQIGEFEKALEILENTNAQLKHEKDALEAEIQTLKAENKDIIAKNDRLIDEMQKTHETDDEKNTALQEQIDELQNRNADLQRQFDECNEALNQVREERGKLRIQVDKLEKAAAGNEKRIEKLIAQLEALQAELDNTKKERNEANSQIVELTDDLERRKANIRKLTEENENLRAQLEQVERKDQELNQAMDNLQNAFIDQLDRIEKEKTTGLDVTVANLTREADDLNEMIQGMVDQARILKSNINEDISSPLLFEEELEERELATLSRRGGLKIPFPGATQEEKKVYTFIVNNIQTAGRALSAKQIANKTMIPQNKVEEIVTDLAFQEKINETEANPEIYPGIKGWNWKKESLFITRKLNKEALFHRHFLISLDSL